MIFSLCSHIFFTGSDHIFLPSNSSVLFPRYSFVQQQVGSHSCFFTPLTPPPPPYSIILVFSIKEAPWVSWDTIHKILQPTPTPNNNQRQGVLVLSLLPEHSGLTTRYGIAQLITHVLVEIITFITKPCIDRTKCSSLR